MLAPRGRDAAAARRGARSSSTATPRRTWADADYVVRSSAVAADNVEVVEASARGLPSRKLAEAVGELMRGRERAWPSPARTARRRRPRWSRGCCERGGLDPLALIGADTPAFAHGARPGDGPMVVEADEYDRRFLHYWPEVAVVTSIEADHLDYYRDLAEIRGASSASWSSGCPRHGRLIVCADDPCARGLRTTGAARDVRVRRGRGLADRTTTTPVPSGGCAVHAAGRRTSVGGRVAAGRRAQCAQRRPRRSRSRTTSGSACARRSRRWRRFEGPRRRFETQGQAARHLARRRLRAPSDRGRGGAAAARAAADGRGVGGVSAAHDQSDGGAARRVRRGLWRCAARADPADLSAERTRGRGAAGHVGDLVERSGSGHPDARVVDSFDDGGAAVAEGARAGRPGADHGRGRRDAAVGSAAWRRLRRDARARRAAWRRTRRCAWADRPTISSWRARAQELVGGAALGAQPRACRCA